MTARLAQTRADYPGLTMWFAEANGVGVRFITTNPDLLAYIHPFVTDDIRGFDLKDQHGHFLTSAWIRR